MKFMKLGSRPDTFYTTQGVRSVSSEVATDLIIQLKGTTCLLHKFPLLSKCVRLQRVFTDTPEVEIVELPDFPGGVEAFEVCAKFCYGITITISAYNLVSIRCAAEYLQMTEDVEKGNLIYKIQVFFTSCILHGWRDTIVTLQTTKAFPLWSEDLGIISSCIQAIAAQIVAPTKVRQWRKGWWGEDLAELGMDLYWRAMIGIKSGGRVPSNLICDALRIYASTWLPNIYNSDSDSEKHRLLLESIVSLLPSSSEKGQLSCSFLLKLVKAVNILKASPSSKADLAARIGVLLEEASVADLLIPSPNGNGMYDVDIVITILEHFMLRGQTPPTTPPRNAETRRRRSRSAENLHGMMFEERRRSCSTSHSNKLKVAKLVDVYLQKIAEDTNLPLSKFIAVAEAIPNFARPDHDHLYKAIHIYLKEHPELSKSERKRVCRLLDCKKLSVEACMHAAQNERLPLRVVVQVLFFEQARAGPQVKALSRAGPQVKALSAKSNAAEDEWSIKCNNVSTLKMKLDEDDHDLEQQDRGINEKSSDRPKRMFTNLWPSNRSITSEKN